MKQLAINILALIITVIGWFVIGKLITVYFPGTLVLMHGFFFVYMLQQLYERGKG